MNKEALYKIAKKIPKPIRKAVKLFYNPIIPVISKLEYGEDAYPEATDFMCKKLEEVINKKVDGDIIEFGTYRGGATLKLAKTLKKSKSEKRLYSLDTFEGLPKETKGKDKIPRCYKGAMDKNDFEKVNKMLKMNKFNNVILMKGLFSKSIPKLKDKKFCFAFVDADLYQGTKEALEFLIPRLNKNGITFIDDWDSKSWSGVKKAVLELLPKEEIIFNKRAYWIKK